ncbi:MAG TPA: hypothetical protein VGB04_02080 [Allosphingosinicella sp.]|jgi:hypothetical protein
MERFDGLIDALESGAADDERLARLMVDSMAHPDMAAARARLDEEDLNGATIGALYSGYRTIQLGDHRGWSFSLARVTEASDYVSSPTCRSVALCLEAEAPIELEIFRDMADGSGYDLPGDQPLSLVGTRRLTQGQVVRSLDYSEWPAPAGKVDAIFLKAETDTERPTTVAYSRETLRPVSIGFADHRHTADHFFATLVAHAVEAGEAVQNEMGPAERQQFRDLLVRRGGNAQTHLATRWKYIQALGRLDGTAAREALRAVAAQSQSRIGNMARGILSA